MAELTVNQSVAAWAAAQLDTNVGRGECWDLANSALLQAGARSSTTTGANDDYVWGKLVALKDAIPGDILQYKDFTVTTTTKVVATFSDSVKGEDVSTEYATYPHHTSVVSSNPGKGVMVVIEQNYIGKKEAVRIAPINWLPETTSSSSRESMPRGDGYESAMVVTTVTIKPTGTIKAYHPVLQ